MENQIVTTGSSIWAGITAGFTSFMDFLPALIGAVLVLVIGWFISGVVAKIVERVLEAIKLEQAASRTGVSDYLHFMKSDAPVSHLFAELAKWFIRLIFIQAAANLLHMPQVTAIINSILLFIPNLFVAMAILVAGAMLSRFLGGLVESSVQKMGVGRANLFALLTRYAVFGFAFIAAFNQVGIATNLINILFTGLVGSISLALGLAFGLGGQSLAGEVTRQWYEGGKEQAGKLRSVGEKK